MKKEDVFKELSATEAGLSSAEASERLKKYGKNEIAEEKAQSPIMVFLGQYKDFLVIILIIAAIISMALGDVESSLVILIVLTINAI